MSTKNNLKIYNMDTKSIKIIPPEGMEAYQDGNEIKFRPIKAPILSEVYRKLFANEDVWRPSEFGVAEKCNRTPNWHYVTNCTSQRQAEKLIAINKLLNVAKYLNGGWKPDWENYDEFKYYIYISSGNINIDSIMSSFSDLVYFRSRELAQQAINILGEETIKLALCTDW